MLRKAVIAETTADLNNVPSDCAALVIVNGSLVPYTHNKVNNTWTQGTTVGGGQGADPAWGNISGDIADQQDLQAVIGGCSSSNHNHDDLYAAKNHAHDYEPADANIQSHIASVHAPSNAQKNSDITKAEIEAKLTGAVTSHTHDYAASNHNHDLAYAGINHNHNATYAALSGATFTGKFGYGSGGLAAQATNKTTGVTLNALSGAITTHNAALAAGAEAKFTVTNNQVAISDVPVVCVRSGGTSGSYDVIVSAVANGSFDITLTNLSTGSLSQAIVINFVIIKG